MKPYPRVETERLILRAFEASDASELARLAGEREIAENTLSIPHPYPPEAAVEWIGKRQEDFENDVDVTFAITERDGGALAGGCGIMITRDDERAEIGYWIGKPFWGRGYATEAAAAIVRYGFLDLGLHRIQAAFFERNQASGKVIQSIGMKYEGRLRHYHRKWGEFLDMQMYALLREEWDALQAGAVER